MRADVRVAGAIVLGGLAVAHAVPEYYVHLLVLAEIFAIFALSLDVLMGYVGLPSLGHAAFFGVGGYTVALLVVRQGVDWGTAALAALVASALVAAVFGLIAIRAVDVFFMMITLALCQILWGLANRWGSFTGGYNGLPGLARPLAVLESAESQNRFNHVFQNFLQVFCRENRPLVVFLDDMRPNIRGAEALGIRSVWFDVADPAPAFAEVRELLGLPEEGRDG